MDKEYLLKDKKIPFKIMIKRTLKYIKPEISKFIISFLLIILSVGISTLLPLIISNITDSLKEGFTLNTIFLFLLGYLLLTVINLILSYIQAIVLQTAGQNIVLNLRNEVFNHIENMSLNQLNEIPVGSLVTRVCNYTRSMSDLFTNTLVNIIKNVITIIVVYGVMLTISYKLSLILSIVVIVVFLISFFFSRIVKKLFREERKGNSILTTILNEDLDGMKIIRIFNQSEKMHLEFDKKNKELKNIKYKITLAFALYRPLITFIYYLAIAITLYFGIKIGLGTGEIVAFYLLLSSFFNPVQNLADQLNNLQRALTSTERIFNLMDIKPDFIDKEGAITLNHFEGKIEFRHVYFAYKDEDWILKDVSFIINPKESCAFVGATGAGKSTILNLIVRNYKVNKGEILIDDININDLKISCLKKKVGQMLQDVFLFSGTIRTNITLYDDELYTDKEINKVCDYINASSFINKLDNKLDYMVTEGGENFSTGQRQLLSFARTVLYKPEILILDEATASIDTETEVLIQDSLKKMQNIGTMLIVAHRLSTIQHCDQILFLKNGEIIERGNHQELLKLKGQYYKLYELQFRK